MEKRKINSNYLLSTFSRPQVGVCGKRDTKQEAAEEILTSVEKQASRTYWTVKCVEQIKYL